MKCYKFVMNKWFACPECLASAVAVVRDWCVENDYVKTPLYVADDVYIYARDKDVIHMVIESHDWDDLPTVLDKRGADILDFLLGCIENRDVDTIEDDFYDYLTQN